MDGRGVAFIGLGGMGAAMAHRLLDTGHRLTVWNRTAGKADALVADGAVAAASPAEAVEAAGAVLVSLADEAAVEEVVLTGLAGRLKPGTLLLDTSTVSPAFSRAATARLAEAGVRRVETCVVGNPLMARSGGLRVFAAGDPEDVAAAERLLAALGKEVLHLGPAGTACVLKLAFNVLLGAQVTALAEAVALVEREGLGRESLLEALTGTGFSAPTVEFRAGFMRERRYEPAAFRARLMEKDLRLALSIAGESMPVTARAADRYAAAVEAGHGDHDAAVVVELD